MLILYFPKKKEADKELVLGNFIKSIQMNVLTDLAEGSKLMNALT